MAVPGLESYIVVTVDEVDLANRLVHVKDKTGSKFQAFFRDHPGGWFYVPNQGEKWTAKKIGNFWHLEHMLDSLDDHTWAAANLQPGDLVIRAGKTWIMGTAEATTAAVDTNTTQIATTAFVLGQAASATPLIDSGSGVVGTSTRYARGDHTHPKPTLPNTQVFNPGAGQLWTKPAGATVISIFMIGAGGGGGGGSVGASNISGGAGGGSVGGIFIPNILASAFGSSVSINVGAGGSGGAGSVGAGNGTDGNPGSRATSFDTYFSIAAGGGGQGGRTASGSTGGAPGALSLATSSTPALDFINVATGVTGGGGNRGSAGNPGSGSAGGGGGGIAVAGGSEPGTGAAAINFAPLQTSPLGGAPGGNGPDGYSSISSGATAGAFSAPYRGQGGSGAASSTGGTTGGKGGNGGQYGTGGGGGGSSDSGTGGAGGNGSDGIVVVISW